MRDAGGREHALPAACAGAQRGRASCTARAAPVHTCTHRQPPGGTTMKGMDQKKSEKKKPEKNLKEKRAAKKEKKGK